MDALQMIAQETGIPVAELKRIKKEGKEVRKEMLKYGCTEHQITRGMLRILDATMGTKHTVDWN